MTVALEGGEWSAARCGRTLPPGKTRYPFYRRLGGPQGRSGRDVFFYYLGINKQQLTIAYNTEQEPPPDYVSNNRILKPIYRVILRQHRSFVVSISIYTEYDLDYTVCIYK